MNISIYTAAEGSSFSPEPLRQNLRAGVEVEKVSSFQAAGSSSVLAWNLGASALTLIKNNNSCLWPGNSYHARFCVSRVTHLLAFPTVHEGKKRFNDPLSTVADEAHGNCSVYSTGGKAECVCSLTHRWKHLETRTQREKKMDDDWCLCLSLAPSESPCWQRWACP